MCSASPRYSEGMVKGPAGLPGCAILATSTLLCDLIGNRVGCMAMCSASPRYQEGRVKGQAIISVLSSTLLCHSSRRKRRVRGLLIAHLGGFEESSVSGWSDRACMCSGTDPKSDFQ